MGLVLGVTLVLLGIPVLQSVMMQSGWVTSFSFTEAAFACMVVLLAVIAVMVAGLRPPKP